MTTRLGFSIIVAGILVLLLRANGVIDTELADVAAVCAIVLGALAVAIDGEAADTDKPRRSKAPAAKAPEDDPAAASEPTTSTDTPSS